VRRGDVVLKFNNKDVEDIKQFKKLVKDAPDGKSVSLLILRRGSPIFLALKITEED